MSNALFQLPFNLPDSVPQEVHQAFRFHANAIQDCQTAILGPGGLLAQVQALKNPTSTSSSTTTVIPNTETVNPGTSSNVGSVNDQSGNTAYVTQQSDNGALIVLNDASAIALTLTSGVTVPYCFFVTNLGAGLVTLTPTSGIVNGAGTLPIDNTAIVAFDGTDWWSTELPVSPVNTPAVAHEWLSAFNSTTGVFTQTQPTFADISGTPTTTQVPFQSLTTTGSGAATLIGGILNVPTPISPSGATGTITLAALTLTGTQGSITVVNGIITAYINPT
jgi:hypothetical protein